MGKLFRKIFSGISAVTLITTAVSGAFCVSAVNEKTWNDYVYLDDKGMLSGKYGYAGYSDGAYGYYITKTKDDNDHMVVIHKNIKGFSFVLNDNISSEDAQNEVINIIEKYYPENNLNSSDSVAVSGAIEINASDNGKLHCNVYDYVSAENAKINSKNIMNELVQKALISEFYDCGETGTAYAVSTANCNFINVYLKENIDKNKEEIEKYIAENSLNCTFKTSDEKPEGTFPCPSDMMYFLVPDEELTMQETFELAVKLYEKFDLVPVYVNEDFGTSVYGKNSLETIQATESTINFGTPTIMGDLNLDNESGLSDIVALTKYTASAELFPINDPTALANADVNQDKVINSIDVNMLVEKALGHYENAVS